MNSSRSNRVPMDDLELRLALSLPLKGGMLANNSITRYPPSLITIEDEDDDVHIYSPDPVRETIRFFPRSSSWAPALPEEDLELRLGLGAYSGHSVNLSGQTEIPGEGSVSQPCRKCGKVKCLLNQKKHAQTLPDVEEIKLRCGICMDEMKEEASTTCGHIFCNPCITDAVLVQRKCPACRTKLSIQNIHRIYLPGATS